MKSLFKPSLIKAFCCQNKIQKITLSKPCLVLVIVAVVLDNDGLLSLKSKFFFDFFFFTFSSPIFRRNWLNEKPFSFFKLRGE